MMFETPARAWNSIFTLHAVKDEFNIYAFSSSALNLVLIIFKIYYLSIKALKFKTGIKYMTKVSSLKPRTDL